MDDETGNGDNPGKNVTAELCKAYRETLDERIDGLRNQIFGAIALSTAVISLIMYIINLRL